MKCTICVCVHLEDSRRSIDAKIVYFSSLAKKLPKMLNLRADGGHLGDR